MVDLENFPTREMAKELLGSVTKGWYDKSYVGKWMYQVMGLPLGQVKAIYEDLPDQFFIETATWGLDYHEQKYGLPIRRELSYEERRRIIYQKIRSRVPMSPYHMERLLNRQLGINAEVSDIHDLGSLDFHPSHPNQFKVTVWEHDTNSDLDFDQVENVVKQMNQSHTVFTVEHRQVFERPVSIYVGAVISELVDYVIRPRQLNRNVEAAAHVGAVIMSDWMILEEIAVGRSI